MEGGGGVVKEDSLMLLVECDCVKEDSLIDSLMTEGK